MNPEQLAILRTVYDALTQEWGHLMRRHDVPAGWLVDLHARLSGPEFTGSGVDVIEVWRLDALLSVEARLEQVAPGYLDAVTPTRHTGPVG